MLVGFIGETYYTEVGGRMPPHKAYKGADGTNGMILAGRAAWSSPDDDVNVWVGVIQVADQAEADAIEAACDAVGIRCRCFTGFNVDGGGERIGIIKLAIIRWILQNRGLLDADDDSFDQNTDANTLIDRLSQRLRGPRHGRAYLLSRASQKGLS